MNNESFVLDEQGVSIVALGSFNPAIFHPLWFSTNRLIPEEEANKAQIKIVHNEVSIFTTDWFSLQVTNDRFVVETKDPAKYQPIRDLAIGTFRILEHTPITAFGLNKYQGIRAGSDEQWHAVGHCLAPKKAWEKILDKPGMRSLVVAGKRKESESAAIQIQIEPVTNVARGILIRINEHYDMTKEQSGQAEKTRVFLTTLQRSWESFLVYCDRASETLMEECKL